MHNTGLYTKNILVKWPLLSETCFFKITTFSKLNLSITFPQLKIIVNHTLKVLFQS